MKILHVGKYYPPFFGGIEKVNFDLVESLNKKGISTDVICFNHEKGSKLEKGEYVIYREGTLIEKFSTPISISFYNQLRKIQKNYDIIHVHLPNPVAAIALQLSRFKGKLVLHWHSDIINQKLLKKVYIPFQELLLHRADKIIVTTSTYLFGSQDLKPFRNKCEIIPIGIDRNEFIDNLEFRAELNNRFQGKKVVFSLGRLIYYKGFEYLINAALDLPSDYVVLIGGVGELEEGLQKLIKKNNLEGKVILLGKLPFDQIGEYYRRADLFCLASNERSEAFGVVLIEAMSFGCPIVTTAIEGSGVTWVNKNNETGLVVAPNSSKALAQGIIKILSNEILRTEMSKNSLNRYEDLFHKEKMTELTTSLYKNILESDDDFKVVI
ncbi:glycosyltransferase [Christiangramia aquimixticola]|uniref:glycosyltransferase n=1 Tax=Christiangramia aquimixticola TaxID=1697558 RepID=UPI003AA99C5E